jgi:hypothetical protein
MSYKITRKTRPIPMRLRVILMYVPRGCTTPRTSTRAASRWDCRTSSRRRLQLRLQRQGDGLLHHRRQMYLESEVGTPDEIRPRCMPATPITADEYEKVRPQHRYTACQMLVVLITRAGIRVRSIAGKNRNPVRIRFFLSCRYLQSKNAIHVAYSEKNAASRRQSAEHVNQREFA